MVAGVAALLGILGVAASASATEGDFDKSFGFVGSATTSLASDTGRDSIGADVAIDAQGRVVTVGFADVLGDNDFAVARYQPNGILDTSFDGDGKRVYDIVSGDEDRANAVAIDPQGRIVVVGATDGSGGGDWVVLRLLPNGDPDPAFTGPDTISFGPDSDIANAVAMDSSGRIVVAGETVDTMGRTQVAMARLKPDGTLDPTFNGNGKLVTYWGPNPARGQTIPDVVIDPQGRIIVGDGFNHSDPTLTVARYLDDGGLDTSFGGTGVRRIDVGQGGNVRAFAVDQLGRIVVGGSTFDDATGQLTLLRMDDSGALDPSFGGDGIARLSVPETESRLRDIALDSQGRIIVVGDRSTTARPHATVARYTDTGELDPTFGSGGLVTDPTGEQSLFAGVIVDDHDRIVAAGYRSHDADGVEDFVTSRFIGDESAPVVNVPIADGSFLNTPTPEIDFTASEGASFICGFDGAADGCASPFTPAAPLADGPHTFAVAATDPAGNTGNATRTITIDTVAPDVNIKGKKKLETGKPKTKAKFKLKTSEPATLTCHVDKKRPKPCSRKYKTPKLTDGKHKVFVEAVDRAGNTASDKQKVKVVAN